LAAGLQEKLFQPGSEKSNGFYAELPIKIKLVGSYHDFGNFVSGIAALPRIVTLHDIQITPVDTKGGYDNLTMDVTAKTYRYIEDEGGDAGGAKKKAEARREKFRNARRRLAVLAAWSRPAAPAANPICRNGSRRPRRSPAAAFRRCRK
jgi:hypothetical protein